MTDKDIYRQQNFGNRVGFGRRSALLIVDFTVGFKTEPSAFFGTGLGPWLVHFRPIVARDCVGDRALGPHEANLFDMAQKYADILERDEIISALQKR